MKHNRHNRHDMIKAFCKLTAIIQSCKTLQQLTTVRNFILNSKQRCGLSDRMMEDLQDKLNYKAQQISKKNT